MKSRKIRNYQVFAAGHLWQVASATLTTLPDGNEGLSVEEVSRIHRAVANALCGSDDDLSFEAFEFLCDITGSTFSEAASHLGMNKSTVSTWRRRGVVPSKLVGHALKRWFWFKLFGEGLGDARLPIQSFMSDMSFLETASRAAITAHLTDEVVLKAS